MIKYIVRTYSNENETVLDNTMGSNTTGLACKELNRNYIGIENDPEMFEIAKKRVEEKRKEKELQAGTLFGNEM